MNTGPTDLARSRPGGTNVLSIDKVSADMPSQDLLRCIREHEENGMPLVITGIDCDSRWRSRFSPVAGDNVLVDSRAVDSSRENDASSTLSWLEGLLLIPDCLLSRGEGTEFPKAIKDLKCEHDGRGRPFQQNHCGSVLQHLTFDLPDGSSDTWFVSAASSAQQVVGHPPTSASGHLPTFLATSELSSCPFPIYTHHQCIGDLFVLPPSCYGQNLRDGGARSVSWSRMTLHSLELSVYRELPMYRRCCRPERYEIRQTIRDALVSRTTTINQLVSHSVDANLSQESPLAGITHDLIALVRLFDEILQDEYCDDHVSLDYAEIQRDHLICNFCGSCLFLSSFLCRRCSQESTSPVLICGGCYVEGRSCHCDSMSPVRLGDFLGALQDRNNAISSLSRASHLHHVSVEGLVEGSENWFMWPRVAVFGAARELWMLKNIPESEKKGKTCTLRKGNPSHPAPYNSLAKCKKCHAAKCFTHLLTECVHASEALLAGAADPSNTIWHKRHQESRRRSELPLASLPQVHEFDTLERRVFFAQHFSSNSPLKPGMSLGFYDVTLQDTPPSPVTAEPTSNRGITSYTDPSTTSRPFAPVPPSRAGPRSTIAFTTDVETPIVADQMTERANEQPTEDVGLDPGPSRRNSKRTRSLPRGGDGGDDDDDDDDEYLPRKRARLSRPVARGVRATQSLASVGNEVSDSPQQPAAGSTTEQPNGVDISPLPSQQGGGSQSSASQPPIRRRPTRMVLGESSLSGTSPDIVHPLAVDPPAWKYFNPSVDMRATIQPTDPVSESSALAGATPADRSETVEHYRSLRSPFPQSPFVGLQPLPQRYNSNEAGPSRMHRPPRAEGSGTSSDPPSTTERPMPQQLTATGSSQFYQQFSHMRLRRQDSIVWPPTNPVNPQVSGTFTTSAVTTLGRRDSREDVAAQRVLETIQGDSLSRENMAAYIDILRKYGALEK